MLRRVSTDCTFIWHLLFHALPCSQATYDLGAKNSKTRSKYDTDSAWFWMLAGNTSTITGATFDIAIAVSTVQHTGPVRRALSSDLGS